MEGYYWRITDPATHRVVIALIGIQTDDAGCWALAGLGTSDGFWRQAIIAGATDAAGGARPIRRHVSSDRIGESWSIWRRRPASTSAWTGSSAGLASGRSAARAGFS